MSAPAAVPTLDAPTLAWIEETATTIAANLTHDGDTFTMDDGREVELRVQTDEYMSIMDEQGPGMWCGQLEWTHQTNDYGWPIRPEWADGGAEILRRERGDVLWWRPLDDCLKDRTIRDAVRSTVLELLEYGYSIVTVEVDGYDATLCGCDNVYPELVQELASEALHDATVARRGAQIRAMGRVLLGA